MRTIYRMGADVLRLTALCSLHEMCRKGREKGIHAKHEGGRGSIRVPPFPTGEGSWGKGKAAIRMTAAGCFYSS